MTLHRENAMARFLYAMLKQMNVRNIDWNEVASDPVLLEPISNGHAARMRFFRFRDTVDKSDRRASGTKGRARVTKAKKEKTQKKKEETQKTPLVKAELLTPGLSAYDPFSPAPATLASPFIGETQDDFDRYLTPCSDDTTQTLVVHPAALDSRIHTMPLFPPASCGTDFLNHAVREPAQRAHSPSLPAFHPAYELDGYEVDVKMLERPHSNPTQPQDLNDCTHDWDDRFNDTQPF